MPKLIKIKGMMCEHCEKKVRNALEKIGTVDYVSHDKGEALLNNSNVDNTVIKNTIEDLDFEVLEILDK